MVRRCAHATVQLARVVSRKGKSESLRLVRPGIDCCADRAAVKTAAYECASTDSGENPKAKQPNSCECERCIAVATSSSFLRLLRSESTVEAEEPA